MNISLPFFKRLLHLAIAASCLISSIAIARDVQRTAELLSGRPTKRGEKASGLYAYYKTGNHLLSKTGRGIIQKFAQENLSQAVQSTETVFYPFGGPDVLYPTLFFPNMKTLILVGAEPLGELPEVSDLSIASYKEKVEHSISSLLKSSFYKTIEMLHADPGLRTLTKIVASIALLDASNITVNEVKLDSSGKIVPFVPRNSIKKAQAVQIKYTYKGMERTVYYLQQNLQESEYQGLRPLIDSPKFLKFVRSFSNFTSFYKAASYLSHYAPFGTINSLALEADYLVQTDTGIPYRYFQKGHWDITLFGNYVKPIPLFHLPPQEDLKAALISGEVKLGGPLPFKYDYGSLSQQNIIYAINLRKAAAL